MKLARNFGAIFLLVVGFSSIVWASNPVPKCVVGQNIFCSVKYDTDNCPTLTVFPRPAMHSFVNKSGPNDIYFYGGSAYTAIGTGGWYGPIWLGTYDHSGKLYRLFDNGVSSGSVTDSFSIKCGTQQKSCKTVTFLSHNHTVCVVTGYTAIPCSNVVEKLNPIAVCSSSGSKPALT